MNDDRVANAQVRRRMLAALADCPANMCEEVSWLARLRSALAVAAAAGANALLYCGASVVFTRMGLSFVGATVALIAAIFAVTAALYIYYVYIVNFRSHKRTA
jgi:hypothetical protein